MNLIEPKYVDVPGYGTIRICGVFDCTQQAYTRGVCNGHYRQHREGKEFTPLKRYSEVDYGPCAFPGCIHRATTKYGRKFCQSHINHVYREGEPRELLWQKNWGITDNGTRICKNCKEEKPLSEYYDRNQWKGTGQGSQVYAVQKCFGIDARYYRYQTGVKSDGTDPKGYNV
jgi:hypothetical protein